MAERLLEKLVGAADFHHSNCFDQSSFLKVCIKSVATNLLLGWISSNGPKLLLQPFPCHVFALLLGFSSSAEWILWFGVWLSVVDVIAVLHQGISAHLPGSGSDLKLLLCR